MAVSSAGTPCSIRRFRSYFIGLSISSFFFPRCFWHRCSIPFGVAVGAPSRTRGQSDAPASHSVSVSELLRYEATGLSLLSPYTRGKIPVLFIHGLWLNPGSWHRMIATLEDDPAINGRFQFWT